VDYRNNKNSSYRKRDKISNFFNHLDCRLAKKSSKCFETGVDHCRRFHTQVVMVRSNYKMKQRLFSGQLCRKLDGPSFVTNKTHRVTFITLIPAWQLSLVIIPICI